MTLHVLIYKSKVTKVDDDYRYFNLYVYECIYIYEFFKHHDRKNRRGVRIYIKDEWI